MRRTASTRSVLLIVGTAVLATALTAGPAAAQPEFVLFVSTPDEGQVLSGVWPGIEVEGAVAPMAADGWSLTHVQVRAEDQSGWALSHWTAATTGAFTYCGSVSWLETLSPCMIKVVVKATWSRNYPAPESHVETATVWVEWPGSSGGSR